MQQKFGIKTVGYFHIFIYKLKNMNGMEKNIRKLV